MKYQINASNRTLEFEVDDVEIFHVKLTAVNTWLDLYAGYNNRVDPFDHIIAIHVYGKNTAGSPAIGLDFRTRNNISTAINGPFNIHSNKISSTADKFVGMSDINHVFTFNESSSLAGLPANDNNMQMQINSLNSSFAGYIYVNIYVVRNSR